MSYPVKLTGVHFFGTHARVNSIVRPRFSLCKYVFTSIIFKLPLSIRPPRRRLLEYWMSYCFWRRQIGIFFCSYQGQVNPKLMTSTGHL